MSEKQIMNAIWLTYGARPDMRLMRNNSGMLKDANGRPVKFGLGTGTSDLIGWRTITITPDMVGREVAVFTAIECKRPHYPHSSPHVVQQARFLDTVKNAGGIALFATCTEDVEHVLSEFE